MEGTTDALPYRQLFEPSQLGTAVLHQEELTLSSRTLVMEKRGTISITSSSARKVSSSGEKLGWRVLERAMMAF